MAGAVYVVDYNALKYKKEFHGSKDDLAMDVLISYADYICFLFENKFLKENEMSLLEYEIRRILTNQEIKNYLWNIYNFSKKLDCTAKYESLINYGINKKLVDENIKDENSKLFSDKKLNF